MRHYCTGILTVALCPPIESVSVCVPVGAVPGITTLTWYSPMLPGVRPLNTNWVELLPIVTLAGTFVLANGPVAAVGSPLAGWLSTGPSPLEVPSA